jgi:hypothetical protein
MGDGVRRFGRLFDGKSCVPWQSNGTRQARTVDGADGRRQSHSSGVHVRNAG